MNDFARFLLLRRKELGLTQQKIADRLNVSNKAVSKWETGECYPDTALFVPLSEMLECSVDELLRGVKSEEVKAAPAEPAPTTTVIIKNEARPSRPWRKLCVAAGIIAVLGVLFFLLFEIAFQQTGGNTTDEWALGLLVFFFVISFILLLIAAVVYTFHQDK